MKKLGNSAVTYEIGLYGDAGERLAAEAGSSTCSWTVRPGAPPGCRTASVLHCSA